MMALFQIEEKLKTPKHLDVKCEEIDTGYIASGEEEMEKLQMISSPFKEGKTAYRNAIKIFEDYDFNRLEKDVNEFLDGKFLVHSEFMMKDHGNPLSSLCIVILYRETV